MGLAEILIVLAVYMLIGTHLFVMNRWLDADTKSTPPPPAKKLRPEAAPSVAGLAARA